MRNRFLGSADRLVSGLGLSCLLVVAGCGVDDGIGKRYPVSGTVKLNGEPLTSGMVNYFPEDPNTARPASGTIDESGSYTLTTQSPGDGAMGGKYKVSVSAYNIDKTKTATPERGGSADQVVVAKARGKSLIPSKYSGVDSSGLSATVGPTPSSFDFELVGTPSDKESGKTKSRK